MTKKQLKQYRNLKKEISNLESRIHNAVLRDTAQGSMSEFPYTKHSIKLEGVPDEDNTYRNQLLESKINCRLEFNKLNDFINSIEDSQLRQIFRYKFVDGRSNQWIALKLGYQDESTIRRKINNYFEIPKKPNLL